MRTLIIRPTLSYQGSNSQRKWKLPRLLRRQPLVARRASCWSRRQGSQLVSAFCKSGGDGAGSQGGQGHTPLVWHDDFLGIGTALAPMEFLYCLIPTLLGVLVSGRRSRKPEYPGGWECLLIIKIT